MFRLDAKDPLRAKKAKFWRIDGPEQRRLRLCVSDNDATRSALSILRVIVADVAEMAVIEGGWGCVTDVPGGVKPPVTTLVRFAQVRKIELYTPAFNGGVSLLDAAELLARRG